MIGKLYNYDGIFFRDLTLSLLDKLEGAVFWTNRFSSGDVLVEVPFYYSMVGHEDMLLDSFNDDIVSNNRKTELNTDIIPRAHLYMESFNIASQDFLNPNVFLRTIVEKDDNIKSVLNKVRAIPITVNYKCEILLESEGDVHKCSERLMDALWMNTLLAFEYNRMPIDANAALPADGPSIKINREHTMSSKNEYAIEFTIEVVTHYPAYLKDDNTDGNRNLKPKRTKWSVILDDLKNKDNIHRK